MQILSILMVLVAMARLQVKLPPSLEEAQGLYIILRVSLMGHLIIILGLKIAQLHFQMQRLKPFREYLKGLGMFPLKMPMNVK